MVVSEKKPINRSNFRIKLGILYYRSLRYLKWLDITKKYSKIHSDVFLPYLCCEHRTPLLRKFKGVDMYLQYNKITNLKIAVKKVNKVIIKPGEVFSYWKLIGKPTKRKGYVPGMVLTLGTFETAIGGGLCQLSNLIYYLTIHTPLTVIERHRHGFDVFPDSNRTQAFGSGATCFYNYMDLCIRNDTDKSFQLNIKLSKDELIGYFTSDFESDEKYEVYETDHRFQSEYWGGYTRHNTLRRKVLSLDGQTIRDEFLVENHAIMMYSPLIDNKN